MMRESNEIYKNKYVEDEKELDKLKQQIKNYTSELLKKMQKNDDEKSFLTDNEDEENKNKHKQIFVPQSPADLESQRNKYPKYSRQISPYVSPKKVKSPSERFKQRWLYINQEANDNNSFHRIITNDNDDNHFTFSNDEDFSLDSPNLTPIKKNNHDSNNNIKINSIPNDQRNSFSSGSPNLRFSKQYQQTSKPQKQQNYSSSDNESSLKVIQTEKFKIQNQKTESKEANQSNDSLSRIRDLKKAFEADFPPSNSEINHDWTNNAGNSQNSIDKLLLIEEEEEENDEIVNSSNFNEEEEKSMKENQIEINNPILNDSSNQHKNNDLNINNSREEENENEYIDDDQNLYIEEEEENNFDIDLNETDEEEENKVEKHPKTDTQDLKDLIIEEEEEENDLKIDLNESNENQPQSAKYSFQSEEESISGFIIDLNDTDEEDIQIEKQPRILNNSEIQNETENTENKPIFSIDNNIDIGDNQSTSNFQYENYQKRVESPDRKTKENLSFTTPKCPKGADSFLDSSGLQSDFDNNK